MNQIKQKIAYVLALLLAITGVYGGSTFSIPLFTPSVKEVQAVSTTYVLPTELHWSSERGGWISFKVNDTQRGYWVIECKNSDQPDDGWIQELGSFGEEYTQLGETFTVTESGDGYRDGDVVTIYWPWFFEESGDYSFRIGIAEDEQAYEEGDDTVFTEWSENYSYDADNSKLSTPTNYAWSTTKQSVATWSYVSGAQYYELVISQNDEELGGDLLIVTTDKGLYDKNDHYAYLDQETNTVMYDYSKEVADINKNRYTFRLRALSSDLNKNAHSNWSQNSSVLVPVADTKSTSDVIAEAAEKGDPSIISNRYTTNEEKKSLAQTIQNSTEMQALIKKLEGTYTKNNNITVKTPESSDSKINASEIEVIGAGLAAEKDSSIGLSVGKADPGLVKYDADLYSNVYTFEMKLVQGDGTNKKEVTELKIPITITLPLTLDYTNIGILHFLSDGSVEVIRPAILKDKVKFTITHFSTFAFAEVKSGSSGSSSGSSSSVSGGGASTSGSGTSTPGSGTTSSGSSTTSSYYSSSSSSGGGGGSAKPSYERGKGSAKAVYTKGGKGTVRYEMSEAKLSTKSIKIPATVKIGKKTYKVTTISEGAFTGYDKLTNVVIGKNVKKINRCAFDGCKKLKTITVNTKKLTKKTTKECLKGSSVKTVKVPKNKVKAYKKLFAKGNSGSKYSVKVKK